MAELGGAMGGNLNTLKFGDVVTLYSDSLNGWLTSGDLVVGWGLWLPKLKEKLPVPPRVRETRFMVVPKFYYSTRKAYQKELRQSQSARGGADAHNSQTLERLRAALEVENEQNEAEMNRLMGEDIVYGQTVQLRHVSGEFICVKKTMAKFESQCLKVTMDEHGDEGSWFRIDPAFKFRSNGQRVPHGDSVMFTSSKFQQSLHVSPRCLPFRSLYINGVYEVNASTTPTYFKVIPFAASAAHLSSEQASLRAGQATVIFHSEINAYLMYDPTVPAKGPFWQVKSRKEPGHRHDSKALWIIEAETAEWGGGAVFAQNGVEEEPGSASKKKGYRLEHVVSGQYLSLSAEMLDERMSKMTMTDSFYSSNTLWYFRTKSEEDQEEGEIVTIDTRSPTPIYLQHSSGVWLTQRNPLKKERRGEYSNVHDMHAGCRQGIFLTDSLALPYIDPRPMSDISRVLKLLKPIEFYHQSIQAAEQPPEVLQSSSLDLRAALGMDEDDYDDIYVRTRQVLNELRTGSSPAKGANNKKVLARLMWKIAYARALGRVRLLETMAISMFRQSDEVTESLEMIGRWLVKPNSDGTTMPDKWCQKTLKQQGALNLLQVLLEVMVRVGYVCPSMVTVQKAQMPMNQRTSVGAAAATLSMLRVANAIYRVLELAVKGNRKVAPAFMQHVSIFDRHLGTQVRSAMLMRELYCNRYMLMTLGETKVARYARMFGVQRKPAFILLLRSLIACEGQPITANQVTVTRVLLNECKAALPKVRVLGAGLSARPTSARSGSASAHAAVGPEQPGSPMPPRGAAAGDVHIMIKADVEGKETWIDLSAFRGKMRSILAKEEVGLDGTMCALVVYAECLSLFADLCSGRNEACILQLLSNRSLALEYHSMVRAIRSDQVPLTIRARLWDLVLPLHVDRDPLSVQPNIGRTHVWSRVETRVDTRGKEDAATCGQSAPPSLGFPELVEAVLEFLEGSAVMTKVTAGSLDLLKSVCMVTLRMCDLGLFSESSGALNRLVNAVLDNLLSKGWCATGGEGVVNVQLAMLGVMEHAFGVRTDLRRKALIAVFESEFDRVEGGSDGSRFWTEEAISHATRDLMSDSTVSSRLGLELGGDVLQCLMTLISSQQNIELQARSWTLIMKQASQLTEAVSAARDMQLLTSDAAVVCFNTITSCSRKVHQLTPGAANGDVASMGGLQKVLKQLATLMTKGEYDERLVLENQRLMMWQKLHRQVLEILSIPLELAPPTDGPDRAVSTMLRDLMNDCFHFLIAFCTGNADNQSACYWELPLILSHLSVEGLLASECVAAIFRDNEALCSKVSEKLVRKFLGVIVKHGKSARWLTVLLSFLEVHGRAIERNQDLISKLLQDEAEIILELDGNQGGGEGDAAETLAREGDETRYSLMMRNEHEETNSFLSYHTACLEVLSKCAQGKKPGPKIKCQALLPYDMVIESILDLELVGKPDGDRQLHDPDSLRFVRCGWVKVLRHVYFSSSSDAACAQIADDGSSRIYGPAPAQHPRDKWRSQVALMTHFTQEIDDLTYRLASENSNGRDAATADVRLQHTPAKKGATHCKLATSKKMLPTPDKSTKAPSTPKNSGGGFMGMNNLFSPSQNTPLPGSSQNLDTFANSFLRSASASNLYSQERPRGSDIRLHTAYVVDAIVPCLADYYARQYLHTLRRGSRSSELCSQYAERACAAVAKLIEAGKLTREEDVQACLQMLQAAAKAGIHARTDLQFQTPYEKPPPTHRHEMTRLGRRLEEAWPQFFSEVANKCNVKERGGRLSGPGTKEVARLLSRSHDTFLSSLSSVLAHWEKGPALVPDETCREFLLALRGALYLAVSTPRTEDANWDAFTHNHAPVTEEAGSLAAQQYARFLKVGALRCALLLAAHSNEEVVSSAIRLASQLFVACKSEAQEAAMEVLTNDNRKVLGSLRECLRRNLEQIKAAKKLWKKERLKIQAHSVMTPRAYVVHEGKAGIFERQPSDSLQKAGMGFNRASSGSSHKSVSFRRADAHVGECGYPGAESGSICHEAGGFLDGQKDEEAQRESVQHKGKMACELLEMVELMCRGHQKIQRSLREHDVLSSLIAFMEELERDLVSSLNSKDAVTIFTLAKGFQVLTAAIGGPYDKNRDAISRTSILSMLNRVFGKLQYNGPDVAHNILKARVRSSAAWLLLDLLQAPTNPAVAKRILETIDWECFLGAIRDSTTALQAVCKNLLDTSPEDLLMSTPSRVSGLLSTFLKRFSAFQAKQRVGGSFKGHGRPSSLLFGLSSASMDRSSIFGGMKSSTHSATPSAHELDGEKAAIEEDEDDHKLSCECEKEAAGDMAREGFMAALALELLLGDDLFPQQAASLHQKQSSLRELIQSKDLSFYTQRLASVEISRRNRLERLHFVLPEMAVRLQHNEGFLAQLDTTLFEGLETDDNRERQTQLLSRMVSCSKNLRCEVQVTTGPYSWVVEHHAWLEGVPLWTCVAANVVFLLGFDEHGPGAAVCTTIRYLDMGSWGKPFFHLSPWVLLLLGISHLASSALRVVAMVIQRYPYHVTGRNDDAGSGGKKTAADKGKDGVSGKLLSIAASMLGDRNVVFAGVLLVASLLGLFWSPFCYAIPLCDLLRSPTVLLLLGSVEHNANKLGQGALVGALLVYGHAILGYAFFRGDHAEGKCNNLFGCMTTYLISGIKGDSLEGGALEDLVTPHALWMDPNTWFKILLDMSFHIIIPLILLSIISGIIIDGFGELRDKEAEEKSYREETCVVCGVTKAAMEMVRTGAFLNHIDKEQNRHHYVFLMMAIELQNRDVDTQQEAHVRAHVSKEDHGFLPSGAMCMQGGSDEAEDTKGREMLTIITLLRGMDARVRSVERELRHMQSQAAVAPIPAVSSREADEVSGGLWGAFAGGIPPIGMPGFKMPDMPPIGMPDFKMPEMRMPDLPGVLSDIKAPEFRMPKMPAVPVVGNDDCKQQ